MDTTTDTTTRINKKTLGIILVIVVGVLVVLMASLFNYFLSSRVFPPGSDEREKHVNGAFGTDTLAPGFHNLTFNATLSDGTEVTATRQFEILPPYGATTPTPTPLPCVSVSAPQTNPLACPAKAPWYDVNGDGSVSPADALDITNARNAGIETQPGTGAAWQNQANRLDVTGDCFVTAGDDLAIINYINAFGSKALPQCGGGTELPY